MMTLNNQIKHTGVSIFQFNTIVFFACYNDNGDECMAMVNLN